MAFLALDPRVLRSALFWHGPLASARKSSLFLFLSSVHHRISSHIHLSGVGPYMNLRQSGINLCLPETYLVLEAPTLS